MKDTRWYYFSESNEVVGPVSGSGLNALNDSGEISRETLICQEGTESWIPFSTVFSAPDPILAPPTAVMRTSAQPDLEEIPSARLYVGNLSFDVSERDLTELFSGIGTVENVEIVMNRHTMRSKGFAFVQMQSVEEANRAVNELHDKKYMGGRKLVVSGAKAAEVRPSARTPEDYNKPTPHQEEAEVLYGPPRTAVATSSRPTKRPAKNAEDYAADAICGAAKVTLKAAKFAAPIAGRIGAKVAGRAAQATVKAATPHAKKAVSFFDSIFKQTPEEIAEAKRQERIATYWTLGIFVGLGGVAAFLFALTEETRSLILGSAATIVVVIICLAILVGAIALATSKSGRLILYWFFGR